MAVEKQIKRADQEESIEVILRDGQSLKLRPIRPDDRERLRDFSQVEPSHEILRFQYAKEHIATRN
jgi:hypothetical protein